jgi:DnaJ like chaperone protein
MYIYGKLIGGFFGAFFGPWGLIFGIAIGHLFDKGLRLNMQLLEPDPVLARRVFFKTTFMIMGYIAKSDGRVSEKEIQAARNAMVQLRLRPEQRMMAIQYFNQGKSPLFNWMASLDNFLRNCGNNPQMVQLFVEVQLKAAFADGVQNQQKRHLLEVLCDKLNIPRSVLSQMESHYQAEHVFREPPKRRSHTDELSLSYAILGVERTVTDQEVKKAYRQLMSQHHPDKLAAKGLPEGMIKMATEKTQRIQKAYTIVCESRGM